MDHKGNLMIGDRQVFQEHYRLALAFAMSAALLLSGSTPAHAEATPEWTRVGAIRSLTAEQAAERRPVHVRGVVTVLSGWKSSFFLQDGSAGISVNRSSDAPELHQGQEVEIRGVTRSDDFPAIQSDPSKST